jgi:hypothetical protein
MLKRLLVCLFLFTAASPAIAVDYTDIYYLATESGYGFNVVQSDNFLFVTFFIYGPDKKPTWYFAQLTLDQSGNYNGGLYATTGTYYGMPWNPSDHPKDATQVGTASFQPTSPYTAKFIYTVTTPPALAATFNKELQRQTLTPITLGGTYVGSQSGAYSGTCGTFSGTYTDTFGLTVTQFIDGSVSFAFNYDGIQETCTLSGTLTQYGQLYTMPTTAYKCKANSDGHTTLDTNASMSEIKATPLGIEGKFSAPSVSMGCREDATFGGPLK